MSHAHMPESAPLCEHCAAIFSTPDGLSALVSVHGYRHHSRAQLKRHADLGCALCALLDRRAAGLPDDGVDEPAWTVFACREDVRFRTMMGDPATWKRTDVLPDPVDRSTSWTHPFARQKLGKLGVVGKPGIFWLQVVADPDDPAAVFVEGRPAVCDLGSDLVFATARRWLGQCEHDHAACPGPELPPLPTRVIDVAGGLGGRPSRLHVSGPGEHARYAALSYCWGGPQPYATTRATLERKQVDLGERDGDWPPLGQSIRDALTACRRLAIPYLWVDALCIVQDDEADKTREMAVMGAVYRRATVTLSAAVAARSTDGFLRQLDPPSGIVCSFRVGLPAHGRVSLLEHERTGHGHGRGDPTDRRGWCFQEAVLARRWLLFSGDGLYWDCAEADHQTMGEGPVTIVRPYPLLPPDCGQPGAAAPRLSEHARAGLWMRYVCEYSKRQLTVPADRTHAIAGIGQVLAAAWQDRYQDRYLAQYGVFCGRQGLLLALQLTWRLDVFGAEVRLRQDTTARVRRLPGIPTWSWASLTGPIGGLAMGEMRVEVDETDYARLGRGLLRLRAKMMHTGRVGTECRRDWKFQFDLITGSAFDEDHWLVLLGIDQIQQNSIGLVLARSANSTETWQRVGHFCANFGSQSAHPWASIWDQDDVPVQSLTLC